MKDFFIKYRFRICIIGLLVFFVHSPLLNSDIIGIDTEDIIHLQEDFYDGWLQTGRYGLVALKYLLGNVQFNPYFTGMMTLLFFGLAVSAFFVLLDRVGNFDSSDKAGVFPWVVGGFLWISHPIMVEQFYFSLQSIEICVGILLTGIALYLTYRMGPRIKMLYSVVVIALLIVVFATYQVFVVFYFVGTVAILLLQTLREVAEGEEKKFSLNRAFPYAFVFCVALLLYTAIAKLFFPSSGYLQNQVFWGEVPVKDCLLAIVNHMVSAYTGNESDFYSGSLGVLALFTFLILLLFLRSVKNVRKSSIAVVIFFYVVILLTPFMMTAVLGNVPALRSQLILPVMTGFLGYLSMNLLELQRRKEDSWKLRGVFVCIATVCFIGGIGQMKVSAALYYTDRCRYEHDVALARELIQKIEAVNLSGENLPVVVIGKKEFEGNNACVMGEVIGRSFFDYDTDVEPVCFWSTRRVLGFMSSLGFEYKQLSQDMIEKAKEYSCYMPEWPYDNCVQEIDGMIIVKLSHYE